MPELDAGVDDAGAPADAGSDGSAGPRCEGDVTRRFDPAECPDRFVVTALDEERGMWMAARLSLPAGTRDVSYLGYQLQPMGSEGELRRCHDGLPHRVQVFTTPAGEPPPAVPDVLAQIEVPSSAPTGTIRPLVHVLETPLEVAEGHDVFVSIEMVRTSEMLCVLTCRGGDDFGANTYWTNAVNPPYSWAALEAFGFDTEVAACLGHD